jgi:HAMP domain-containing protein
MAHQLEEVGLVVGREGKTRQRVRFGLSDGAWGAMETSVNTLIDDLLWPTTAVTDAIAAVAQGDLLQTVRLDVDGRPLKGEFLRSANIVNTMIKQLGVFTSEVTRVAREVGTDGKLGGQAQVPEVSGVWKDLTESVNSMASNLTARVRNIAEVTIAVANGDLSRKITVDVRGEILELKDTINTMVDQLNGFASEVTRVAREVGTEGRLGGQAQVPGVAGIALASMMREKRQQHADGGERRGVGAGHRSHDAPHVKPARLVAQFRPKFGQLGLCGEMGQDRRQPLVDADDGFLDASQPLFEPVEARLKAIKVRLAHSLTARANRSFNEIEASPCRTAAAAIA